MATKGLPVHPTVLCNPSGEFHNLPPYRFTLPLYSSRGENRQLKFYFPSVRSQKFSVTLSRAPNVAITATIPTQKFSQQEIPQWSSRAIRSFALGELEARRLRYPYTGTEALLLGILFEGTSAVADFLRTNGVSLFKVRDETVNLMGKSECLYSSPERPPLTEQAQRALDRAVEEKLKSGTVGEITITHIFRGIWSEEKSAARKIMDNLGFNDKKAKELLDSVRR